MKNDETNFVVSRSNNSDELYHHGIKGQKWGVRRQKKYQNLVDYTKRKHSESRYNQEVKGYSDELSRMKKQGYSKWAKDNYLNSLSKNDQKKTYNDYMKELHSNIESSKRFANNSSNLRKRLDSIDTSKVSYRKAKKIVRQIENSWINENL